MKINYIFLGDRIRKRRKKLGISQAKLAEFADLSPTNISHIERGTTKVSLPSLVKISNALDTTLDKLICDSLNNSKYIYMEEINNLLNDCNQKELYVLTKAITTLKDLIREAYK